MVRRMIARALVLAPALVVGLWVADGSRWAFSGAVGVALTIGNLWLSAKIIGTVAERSPQMLMAAAFIAFALGLAILTGIALALRAGDIVDFPVTGFTLIGSHLGLVLWEAAGAYDRIPTVKARS
jgi:hypothetical protein